MTTLAWIIIAIAYVALVACVCRWFHVCKKQREYIEGAMRSVMERSVNEGEVDR